MEISHQLLCPTSRSTVGCTNMEETFCTVFCHAMLTHQLPVSWPGGSEVVLCTTTCLLDCVVLGGERTVLCSDHHKTIKKNPKQTNPQKR